MAPGQLVPLQAPAARESWVGRALKIIGLVGSIAAVIVPSLVWYTTNADLNLKKAELENAGRKAAARFEEQYIVLDRPAEIRHPDQVMSTGKIVEDVSDIYGENFMVSSDYRYFTSEEVTMNHLAPHSVVCRSSACESVMRGESPVDSKVVYASFRNLAPNGAEEVTLTLEPYFASPIESGHFHDVFTSRQRREPIKIDLPALKQEHTVLVPLAAVAVFQAPGGEPGFVGIGDTRRPSTICWTDSVTDTQTCRPIRDILTSMVYYGEGQYPGGG